MAAVHETAYPRIRSNLSPKELAEIFSPTNEELQFVKRRTRQPLQRLTLMIMLKVFQRLGYFPLLREINPVVVRHIANCLDIREIPKDIYQYDRTSARKRHMPLVRSFLGVIPYGEQTRKIIADAMVDAAQTKDDLADIINASLEELVRQKHELPAFSYLSRTAKQTRSLVNQKYYQRISNALNLETKKRIANLLKPLESSSKSYWNLVKRNPGKPNVNNLKNWLTHLQWLKRLTFNLPDLSNIPAIKIHRFAIEAVSYNVAVMCAIEYHKKFALAVALIQNRYASALDDLATMYIKIVQKMHSRADQALEIYRNEHSNRTDSLISLLRDVLIAYKSENTKEACFDAIRGVMPENLDTVLYQCDEHTAYTSNNYYAFLPKFYQGKRSLLFTFLENAELLSTTHDRSVEQAIHFLKSHRNSKRNLLKTYRYEITASGERNAVWLVDLSWIPDKWYKLVVRTDLPETPQVNRRYFEICLFSQIKQELKSGDLYIVGSQEYDDYRKQLVSWEEYETTVASYGKQVGISVKSEDFVNRLKTLLCETAKSTDDAFPENEYVRIENGEPVVSRQKSRGLPAEFDLINAQITSRLKPVNLLDVLADTEKWINWTKFFKPLSGFQAKIQNPTERYLLTTFCYGCNLGPSQTERSVKGLDRRQINWINQHHITEEMLDKAITLVINTFNQFTLPKFWGSGKTASVDGTKWDLYEQNLLSEYHIRYGGYGGIGYYHVSDQYIALFSHFIPCGVHEAVYILDGLIKNISDIQPDAIHGDTQAQSYPVFGLAYLLGIDLLPRMRSLKKLSLYRPTRWTTFNHIDDLFTKTALSVKTRNQQAIR